MLLTNRFSFYDKKGLNANPQEQNAIRITIVQPSGLSGNGAVINAYTSVQGSIDYIEILSGGVNFENDIYIELYDVNSESLIVIESSNITVTNGTITAINIPALKENIGFTYPAAYYYAANYMEPVSTGLIATESLFLLENVFNAAGKSVYTFPRVEEYGPFGISTYGANGTSGFIRIATIPIVGDINQFEKDKVFGVSPATISQLFVGLRVEGTGITAGTFIIDIDTTYNLITLSTPALNAGPISAVAYKTHDVRVGNTIRVFSTVGTNPLDGEQVVTAITPSYIYFESTLNIPETPTAALRYSVIPVYQVSIAPSSDEEFFLFDVEYNEDYPTITKSKEIYFTFNNASGAAIPDSIPTGNGLYQRTVYERPPQEALQINIGFQADYEGIYVAQVRIEDVTFPTTRVFYFANYEAEAVAEEARFTVMLNNFGTELGPNEELILRDSDVNEDLTDYQLLNKKRKEMLLEWSNIWPYAGSYRGLINILNWFGYYDVRVKEYWLNVNQEDEYYGKFRQMQVPFQLRGKGVQSEALALLPSKHYKKTNFFGLFYDIIRDNGEFDENGMPLTEDAFNFTNEEVLIKLFALKRYLKEKFLPLNTRIIDITGEGIYYERYAVNNWNDSDQRFVVNLTREIDFTTNTRKSQIIDIRPLEVDDALISPPYFGILNNYYKKYNIDRANISNGGGPYFGEIPTVSFPGQSVQQARGVVRMRGYALSIIAPLTPTGTDYQVGDIITLSGGVYESPIRVTVNTVGALGEVLNFGIIAGNDQGSNYTSFPQEFGQATVRRIVGGQYVTASAIGFKLLPADIPLEAESIVLYDKGLKYVSPPTAVFSPAIGGISADLVLSTTAETPSIYYNDGAKIEPYVDAPNIPVAAPVELSTNFDITWDEVPYRWKDLGGGEDATLKPWVSLLPGGSGQLTAVEIVDPGKDYRSIPSFVVTGGGGYGATLTGSLKNGSLKILEFTVTGIGNYLGIGDTLTLSPSIPPTGMNAVSTGRIVIGNGIPAGSITSIVNEPFEEIVLSDYEGNPISTTVTVGDKIYVHQGVGVVTNGAAYDSLPNVATNGGHVGNLFTWDELGRGDLYQMEWFVTLTEKTNPTHQFNYRSGVKSIDELINHQVFLPYKGRYTVELVVYDTDNNFINEIKNNHVEAYLPEATFSYITRYISDCARKWDEFYQEPIPEFEPTPNVLAPAPIEGVRYNWDNAHGRWINPVFTNSTWEDAQVKWDSLDVGNLSPINSWNYAPTTEIEVLQISAEDNLEGPIVAYDDPTTDPLVLNPRIRVSGQRSYPQIEPAINPNDWVFIRRGDNIYQLEVLYTDYSNPLYTDVYLTSAPPAAFRGSATTWQLLREIGGTIAVAGNQIYDPTFNPSGIAIGEYVRIAGKDDTPKRQRVGIKTKDLFGVEPNNITLQGGGSDGVYYKGGELGKIYKYRGINAANGNLYWDTTPLNSTWVIQPTGNDPLVNDHIGKLYIVAAQPTATPGCLPANPTNELTSGFSTITLYARLSGSIIYEQRLRVSRSFFDTSNTGSPFNIWGGALSGYTGIHVIDIVALDGGKLSGLNAQLALWDTAGADIWIEYEYNVFPTRTYMGQNSAGDAEIYMDFNMYPPSGEFINAAVSEFPASSLPETGWYYDHGNVSGDYSLLVTNTGVWRNGLGTIITVDDVQSELLRSSSSFMASQRDFDEDYAETRLGTFTHTWENYRPVLWIDACYQTWDTLDYQEEISCFFQINSVDQNGSVQFNNDIPFLFQGIVGGMTSAEKWSQAFYELQRTDNPGLSIFDYQLSSPVDLTFFLGQLDTYNQPNTIINYTGVTPVAGDVVVSPYTGPANAITSVGVNNLTMNNALPKKLQFTATTKSGSPFIKNIYGLLEQDLYVGEIITGLGLPSAPSAPAQVLEIVAVAGKVRQIKLSENATVTAVNSQLSIEWGGPTVTSYLAFQNLSQLGSFVIQAFAKTPSNGQLGWLNGQNGVTFNDPVNGIGQPIGHTYPLKNLPKQFGYGQGLVGGFEGGLKEYLLNARVWQVYEYEGDNPAALPGGWYPATDLPPAYQYAVNDPLPTPPAFSNVSDAEVQSNRLPYESGVGGSWRWEETYMGTRATEIPSGTSVLFSSDASAIAGKTRFYWRLYDGENLIVELIDPTFMWTFLEQGDYTLSLEIRDSNDNSQSLERKKFVKVYEPE